MIYSFSQVSLSLIQVHLRDENVVNSSSLPTDIGQIKLFPNPAKTVTNLQIEIAEKTDQLTVDLVGMSGQKIRTWNYQQLQNLNLLIDTTPLQNGEYILVVTTDQGQRSIPLLVQK